MSRTNSVYLSGLSGDLFVESPDFGSGRAALAMDMLSFCTECGCVVYRRDLHDAWHRAESRLAVGGKDHMAIADSVSAKPLATSALAALEVKHE